jgi:hypothetical protein
MILLAVVAEPLREKLLTVRYFTAKRAGKRGLD